VREITAQKVADICEQKNNTSIILVFKPFCCEGSQSTMKYTGYSAKMGCIFKMPV
jgi:hypothetical protein